MNNKAPETESQTLSGMKERFGRTGRIGVYTFIMAAVMLAAVIAVNLIVSALPERLTRLDTSSSGMYTLSPSTEKFISALDEDVTFWFICQGGDEDGTLRGFLDRYASLSGRITVKKADPIADNEFLKDYPDAEKTSNWSVIVESGKRHKTVDYGDLYYYYNENTGRMTPAEYSMYGQYYAQSYGLVFTPFFDGDNQLTGAVEYVTADSVPKVYMLEGHSEKELSTVVTDNLFDYTGVEHEKLNIALGDEIPADASLIIINAPASDITDGEADALIAYLSGGGKIILLTGDGCSEYASLMKLTAAAGMSALPGVVSEKDSSRHYPRNERYIYPTLDSGHDAVKNIASSGYTVIVPNAHAIETGEGAERLIYTGSTAVTGDATEGREYTLAAAGKSGSGTLVWIGSATMLDDAFINGTNGGNFYCFASIFSWMQESFGSALPEIAAVDLTNPTLTLSEGQANFWSFILIFIVPPAVLAAGIVIFVVRRRK